MKKKYTFKIFRFNPLQDKKPYFKEYGVETSPDWSVLDCLNDIHLHQDPTLAFRRSCRSGICGSCAMNVNGKNMLACEVKIADLGGNKIVVQPMPYFEIIKDLVVDLDLFLSQIQCISACIDNMRHGEKERLQTVAERALLDGLYECILCGACTSACLIVLKQRVFKGPAYFLKLCRYVVDTRVALDPLWKKHAHDEGGVWECNNVFNCVEACPKELNPAKAIQLLQHYMIRDSIKSGMPD